MAKTKEQKKKIVEDLKEKIDKQKSMVFVSITGLKAKEVFDLRKRLKKADCLLQVVKKTLLKMAFGNQGAKLQGEVALIFGFKDEISPAKIAYQFSLENKNFKILAGFLENKFREAEEIMSLAQIPSEQELLVKVVQSISAPVSNFVNILQGNIRNFIYALSAIKK